MHILDVISSVTRSSNAPKSLAGAYSVLPDPLAGFNGAYYKATTSKGIGREGSEGRGGAKMIYAPGARNPRAATGCVICEI